MRKLFVALLFLLSFLFNIHAHAQEIYDLNKHLVQPEFSSFEKPNEPNVDINTAVKYRNI
tara:strand:- start:9 stop:188 length:180 start_codon:yes stop_codon:yes gene_type:complete